MKKMLWLTPALLLASCAPSVTGGGAGQPQVMATPMTAIVIHPGETKYVQFNYSRNVVNVNEKYFNDLKVDFADVSGSNVSSPRAYAPWLKMTVKDTLPKGVNLALNSAYIVKDIRNTDNGDFKTTVSYYEVVRVILKVTADADATLGRDMVDVEYTDGNTPSTVPVVIDVQPKN